MFLNLLHSFWFHTFPISSIRCFLSSFFPDGAETYESIVGKMVCMNFVCLVDITLEVLTFIPDSERLR